MFTYHTFVTWLVEKTNTGSPGCKMSLVKIEQPSQKVVVSAESAKNIGELVVWENGHATFMVCEAASGRYLVNDSDVDLSSDVDQRCQSMFFAYFE